MVVPVQESVDGVCGGMFDQGSAGDPLNKNEAGENKAKKKQK